MSDGSSLERAQPLPPQRSIQRPYPLGQFRWQGNQPLAELGT